jgi:hypothetical protein
VRRAYGALLERVVASFTNLHTRGVFKRMPEPRLMTLAATALTHYFVLYRAVSLDLLSVSPDSRAQREAFVRHCARMFVGAVN